MAIWPDLNNDVLERIMDFLSLPNHHRFSAVCRNWRWVAKSRHCSPADQLPWLMMGEHAPTKKRKFYSLTEDRHYYIGIPELQGKYWIGSSYGWLFLLDEEFVPCLFNPFTKEIYETPLFPRFKETILREKLCKAVLSHDPTKTCDFTVLFLYGMNYTYVAFWRHGDSTWTCVPCEDNISDAIFFKGNFYLVSNHILSVIPHLKPNPTLKTVMPLCLSANPRYLVDFLGELLLVKRPLKCIGDWYDLHFGTSRFEARYLNLEKGCSTPCKDFGNSTIFFGCYLSVGC